MISNPVLGSAEKCQNRIRRIVAGAVALATMLMPLGAWGMDSTPKLAFDRSGNLLPLPPIPYLESMRWMSWKPSAPVFKTDTLLLPDVPQPGLFQIPSGHERGLPRVS
ncbi:hypothetical protein CQ14_21165 [Bradyrhizobium lablabi]|uniref:Uncharacterized protein n=1 Tax=Bradyrhizobium lablabi TaxID=722472 RepID=A0A0R3N1L5_9BRAD|nr:hypothetical protein [Bradyrhizobium lablabi]KRR26194.1 hypothetical protein CQ14_21165 [Bradyrhizobium lablabi]